MQPSQTTRAVAGAFRQTEQAAREAGERIRTMLAGTLIDTGKDAVITTVGIGYATYPSMATEVDDLMVRADEALDVSKRAGRDPVFAFSEILERARPGTRNRAPVESLQLYAVR